MTKEELKSLRHLEAEITQCEERLAVLEQQKCPHVVADTVKGSLTSFPYTEHTYRVEGVISTRRSRAVKREIARQRELLDGLIGRLESEQTRLLEEISTVPDSVTRQVLTFKYIDGLSWQAIATRCGYASESTARMMINRYLREL